MTVIELPWHIGDVVRKVRDTFGLTQRDIGRPSTISAFERQKKSYESVTLEDIAAKLSVALQKKQVITTRLRPEDFFRLVPVPRKDEIEPAPVLEPDAVDIALMFQRLSVGGKAAARTVMTALAQAEPNGGLPRTGGTVSPFKR